MKRRLNLCCIILLLATISCKLNAQVALVKEGKPMGRIVTTDNPIDNRAAQLLQDFVSRITQVRLPVVITNSTRKNDVIIGSGNTQGLTEDGFRLTTQKHQLYISSGGEIGRAHV